MKLALRIEATTYRGIRDHVPRLLDILNKHQARATFLLSLGPDRSGLALKYLRTNLGLLRNYGLSTLLRGTLLPAYEAGERCIPTLLAVRNAGFETGITAWKPAAWLNRTAHANATWTERAMNDAHERHTAIFGEFPKTHGAAGWQMNRHAWRLTQRLDFDYASDTRGTQPFIPIIDGEIIATPQLPTTLPTLDEIIDNKAGITTDNVVEHMLRLTEMPPPSVTGHVYTLRPEIEGNHYAAIFEQLLAGWKAQGYALVSLREYHAGISLKTLPRCNVTTVAYPGRMLRYAVQGEEFLAAPLSARAV